MEITSKSYLSLYVVINTGKTLIRHGYKVKIFNTINFNKSMHYNPFAYVRHEVAC